MSGRIAVRLSGRAGTFAVGFAFDVPAAGVTGIVGPSGSGKTTLLRCLAGLDRVAGTIAADGEVWQDERRFIPPERRRAGYVFQGTNLLPHLTVRGNLHYAMKRAPAGRFGFDEVVNRAGLTALLDRMPGRLSGGEAQRAAIARTLLVQPRLLLLDEPLSALDGAGKADLLGMLAELLAGIALPVFYVSHDEAEIERLAARRIMLAAGRVTAVSPPRG